jgi:hypothetical protein
VGSVLAPRTAGVEEAPPSGTALRKKLTRTGNSLALVLDRALLEQTGVNADTVYLEANVEPVG